MVASTSVIDIHLSLVSFLMYRKAAYIDATLPLRTKCFYYLGKCYLVCDIKYRNHNMHVWHGLATTYNCFKAVSERWALY